MNLSVSFSPAVDACQSLVLKCEGLKLDSAFKPVLAVPATTLIYYSQVADKRRVSLFKM